MNSFSAQNEKNKVLTSKDFVTSFPTKNHLHPHSLDLSTEEIHRCARPYGRNIIRLQMVDNIRNGIQTLLNSKHIFVVDCIQEVGCFPRGE